MSWIEIGLWYHLAIDRWNLCCIWDLSWGIIILQLLQIDIHLFTSRNPLTWLSLCSVQHSKAAIGERSLHFWSSSKLNENSSWLREGWFLPMDHFSARKSQLVLSTALNFALVKVFRLLSHKKSPSLLHFENFYESFRHSKMFNCSKVFVILCWQFNYNFESSIPTSIFNNSFSKIWSFCSIPDARILRIAFQ